MNKLNVSCCFFVIGLSIAGCTWVQPVDGANAVALVKPSATQLCDSLGRTTVQVKDKVGFIPRDRFKMQIELTTLAQNAAIELGGDTIVETKPMRDGKQTFAVYKCKETSF